MKQFIIFIVILVILVIVIKYKKPIKENFYTNQWWDSNCSCLDSKDKDNKSTINNINNKVKSMPGHYIESSKDDFSKYYDKAKAGKINSLSSSPEEIENDLLKINYGKGEKETINRKVARGYGTYQKNTPDTVMGKKNFDFNLVSLTNGQYKIYNNPENSKNYRPKEIRNYEGEQSVSELLTKEITAYKNLKEQLPIDQGKYMRQSNAYGKDNGNPEIGKSSDDLLEKIKTLDDYYKYQFLKKKNNVSTDSGKLNATKKFKEDARLNDISTNVWYDGENYKCIESGEYTNKIIDNNNTKNNKCFKDISSSPIKNIGYSDLFGKPHIIQKETKNLVSRSVYSDTGSMSETLAGGQCIKDLSCCGENEQCYPTGKDDENRDIPKFTNVSIKPCPLGLKNKYLFEKPGSVSKAYYSNIGGFYTDNGNTKIKKSGKPLRSNQKDGYQDCVACDYQAGCRFDEEGEPRNTHFEAQSCINGNNRICKPCRVCGFGTEFVEIGCGEGGISQDAVCSKCTPCKENTYKVSGCSNFNSFFDNNCVKMNDCLGKPGDNDKYKDPGEENYQYEIDAGYPGSKMGGRGSGPGGTWENGVYKDGKKLKGDTNSAYLGKNRQCAKCDVCPEGTIIIGGCKGKNNKNNSICFRKFPAKIYLDKNYSCEKGKFLNKETLKELIDFDIEKDILTVNFNNGKIILNPKNSITPSNEVTAKILNFYDKERNIINNINDQSKINDISSRNKENPMPVFTDQEIINIACVDCKKCPDGQYTNPENTGCYKTIDTICIPKTECKDYEIVADEGDDKTDRLCGPCKCPEDKYGIAKCANGEIVDGCNDRKKCGDGEYQFDYPPLYNDTTKNTVCKKCKACPPNSFKLADCNLNTDTVCKIHKQCDPNSQYVVKKGTDVSDTICKCLDGFELPQDEFGYPILDASSCRPNKGECWKDPCHPNAKCYDSFNENGKFQGYNCICNENEGYTRTEKNGIGPGGCRKIPQDHKHELVGMAPADNYDLGDKVNRNMTHLDGDYHLELNGKHIHKN